MYVCNFFLFCHDVNIVQYIYVNKYRYMYNKKSHYLQIINIVSYPFLTSRSVLNWTVAIYMNACSTAGIRVIITTCRYTFIHTRIHVYENWFVNCTLSHIKSSLTAGLKYSGNSIQWNLVIMRSLGPWKLPCYIRFLISGYKNKI